MGAEKDNEVRKSILEAARRVFQKWGMNKTTMEDIAAEAGRAKSTLYYYYKNKEEVFESFVFEELNNVFTTVQKTIVSIDSAKEKLRKYLSTMLIELKKTESLYSLVKGEIKGNKIYLEKLSKHLQEKEKTIIIEILNLGIEKGEFNFIKKAQLAKVATALVGVTHGLMTELFIDNNDPETIDIVTRMILDGI